MALTLGSHGRQTVGWLRQFSFPHALASVDTT